MEGVYVGLTGAMSLERRLEAVAHDLANLNTPGHKRTRLLEQSAYPVIQADEIHRSDPSGLGTERPSDVPFGDRILNQLTSAHVDFSQGALQLTGISTDLSLEGPGFFVVNVDGEDRFTRFGRFEIDAQGGLVMRVDDGWAPVQGVGGDIVVGDDDFQVLEDGRIQSQDGGDLGALRIVDFDDPGALERMGNSLFADTANRAALIEAAPGESAVRQNTLELSNSDPVLSLVEMIEIQRSYQAVSKAMTTMDDATGRRISQAMSR